MGTLTITAKGQVTLRKEVLEHLGVQPGEQVTVDLMPDGSVSVRPKAKGNLADLAGMLGNPHGIHLTIEDMNEVIARGWAGELKDND